MGPVSFPTPFVSRVASPPSRGTVHRSPAYEKAICVWLTVGLRINSVQEWSKLLDRIRLSGVHYGLNEVPLTGERQLFVAMASGVVIELVTDQQSVIP